MCLNIFQNKKFYFKTLWKFVVKCIFTNNSAHMWTARKIIGKKKTKNFCYFFFLLKNKNYKKKWKNFSIHFCCMLMNSMRQYLCLFKTWNVHLNHCWCQCTWNFYNDIYFALNLHWIIYWICYKMLNENCVHFTGDWRQICSKCQTTIHTTKNMSKIKSIWF